MPNTLVNCTVHQSSITFDILMPLSEFEIAFGQKVKYREGTNEKLEQYFQHHLKIEGLDKQQWEVKFQHFQIHETSDEVVGKYSELIVNVQIFPPKEADIRHFMLYYDVIIHQVITHEALFSVVQDWENGLNESALQIGVVKLDIPTGKIFPIEISLESGGLWKGFITMVKMGIHHIAEGTDHLLFLFVLLLPAPLIVSFGKWDKFGGLGYTLAKLLRIITAFTVGHSITLLIGTLGWLPFSSQWVEVTIGFSILVSAIHAYVPLFYRKEIYVAAGFGLIHGLAFSDTLSKLHLETLQMGLSILGFNLGIELMQLLVMLIVIPFLVMMSQRKIYKNFRISMAFLSAIAAIFWIVERISG